MAELLDSCRDEKGRFRAIIVYKKSRRSLYREQRIAYANTPELEEEHLSNQRSLQHVETVLQDHGCDIVLIYREQLTQGLAENRVVVSVGGDGTCLGASHFTNGPLIGVNSSPEHSVGSLCADTAERFGLLWTQILAGDLGFMPIARISARLNGQSIGVVALNDVLITNANPGATSHYTVRANGKQEQHKSSGMWIVAPAGSTGVGMSLGGFVQALEDDRLQFHTREAYFVGEQIPTLLDGVIKRGDQLSVKSRMANGKIYVDGSNRCLPFALDDELVMTLSENPLYMCVTPQMIEHRNRITQARKRYWEARHAA